MKKITPKKTHLVCACSVATIVETFSWLSGGSNGVMGPGYQGYGRWNSKFHCEKCGLVYEPTQHNGLVPSTADEIVKMVEIEERGDRRMGEYSLFH